MGATVAAIGSSSTFFAFGRHLELFFCLQNTGKEGAEHIEQSNQAKRPGAQTRRHALIDDIGRKMRGDESHVEPAYEITGV